MQIKIIVIGVIILLIGVCLYYFQNYEISIGKETNSKIIQQNEYISEKKHLKEGELIKVNFQTKNGTVNFFIVDSSSYKNFEEKTNFFSYERKNNVSFGEVKFKVRYESDWYVVFQHRNDANESVRLDYAIEYFYPISNNWIVYQGYIFIIIIGIFVFLGGFVERRGEEEREEEKKHETKQIMEVKKERGVYIEVECMICNNTIKQFEKSYICQCSCILHESCAKKILKCLSCGRMVK